MNSSISLKIPSSIQTLIFCGFIGLMLGACGVEVGNPGKPVVNDPESATPERTSLTQLASHQHDEAILAAMEDYSDTSTVAFALAKTSPKAEKDDSCSETTDNVGFSRTESDHNVYTLGQGQSQRVIDETYLRAYSSQVSSNLEAIDNKGQGKGLDKTLLRCRGPQQGIVVDWTKVASLNVASQVSRSSSRVISQASSGSTISQSSLSSEGSRTTLLEKVAYSANSLDLRRTLNFSSTMTFDPDAVDAANLKVQTQINVVSEDPLILKESYDNTGHITSLLLVSGSVKSVLESGMSLILHYSDLVLGTSSSCHPTSGTVEGEIYEKDGTTPSDRFTLTFDVEDSVLRYQDGTQSIVDFEACEAAKNGQL